MGRLTLASAFGLAVVLARLPILLAHNDTWLPFEVHAGSFARALLDGVDLDLGRVPIMAHIRGSVVLGWLATPLYALFDNTAFVMKLVPLLWHALTAGLLVWILDRHEHRRAAVIGGLAWLAAPPVITKLSVLGLGSHLESSLLWLAALLPWLPMAAAGRATGRRCLVLGLLVGLAAFFHLQALLATLILVGLLPFVAGRGLFGLPAVLLVIGIALGSSPTWFFEGGQQRFVANRLGPLRGEADAASALVVEVIMPSEAAAERLGPAYPLTILDFGDGDEDAAVAQGTVWLAALSFGMVLAVVTRRRRMLAVLPGIEAPEGERPGLGVFLLLHPLAVAAPFALMGMTINLPGASAGLENRRVAPVVVSLLMLSALGLAGRAGRPLGRVRLVGLAVLLGCGLLGSVQASRATPSAGIPHRGECSEWFLPKLQLHADGDIAGLIAVIDDTDRGDHRFASLRFDLPYRDLRWHGDDDFDAERRRGDALSPVAALYRATALGRRLAVDDAALVSASLRRALSDLPAERRAALLHGIGLGSPAMRPALDPTLYFAALRRLNGLCRTLASADAHAVAEGYGFARGFSLDPYAEPLLRQIEDLATLDAHLHPAVYRGVGWGYRQRWFSAPETLPPGLAVTERVPAPARAAFVEALLGRVLPPEAAVLGPGRPKD